MTKVHSLYDMCKTLLIGVLEKGDASWRKVTKTNTQETVDWSLNQIEFNERQEFLLKLCQPVYIKMQTYVDYDSDDDEEYEDQPYYDYEDDFAIIGNEFDNDFPEFDDCPFD
jgi:hypothetical protein